VDVYIELDTEPREVVVPDDFQKELNKNTGAKRNFGALSYSKKKEYVVQIEGAKTSETRTRRIANTLTLLKKNSK
jgi:uncharacterized protein YdeI (YjbR/CyaY-like superfamily)